MSDQNLIATPSRAAYDAAGAAIQRQGFGESAIEQRRELQSTALAERAKAEIQARYIVALQRPRSIDEMRIRLLAHCKRRGFAERAEYAKPIGRDKVRGPSIRFVETALQEFGNVVPESSVLYDDDEKRTIRVSVTDLERNVTWHEDIVVEKYVERRDARGGEVIGSRRNSSGETVFKVRATEDDLTVKQGAQISKRVRTLGLRILPADIVDEAIALCRRTREAETAQDPDAARRQIADAFAGLGVMPRALDEYLGHPLAETSPAELDDLRLAYVAVRDGDARWADLVEARRSERAPAPAPSEAPPVNPAAQRVRDKLGQRQHMPVQGRMPPQSHGTVQDYDGPEGDK